MNKIKFETHIDGSDNYYFLYLKKNKVIMSYHITNDGKFTIIWGLYIQPEYRGKGLSYIAIKDMIKDNPILYLQVKKNSFVKKIYKKMGFVFYEKADHNFIWMVKK